MTATSIFRRIFNLLPTIYHNLLFHERRLKAVVFTPRLENKEKAEGWKDGRAEAVIELLEDLGELSDSLRNCIVEQTDLELLKKWLKVAAKAESIEEFEQTVGLMHV